MTYHKLNQNQIANCVLDECDSTNSVARELAEKGWPHGTWVSTRIQSSGRGRMGRKWESVEGNLFLSIIVRSIEKNHWSWVPMTTAVAIANCLERVFPEIRLKIKWPNDIWVNEAKVGGILCEGVGGGSNPFVVVGVGINCVSTPQFETVSPVAATDLTSARGSVMTHAQQIRDPLRFALLEGLDQLANDPSAAIKNQKGQYEAHAAFPKGASICWGAHSGSGLTCGVVEGLGLSGELWVTLENQTRISLFAEDVQRVRKSFG